MIYYIDTEFIEGVQKKFIGKTKPTIDLISIGIINEDNGEYYAISKDFNLKEAWNRWQQRTGEGDRNNIEPKLYWIRDNVLKPIYKELHNKECAYSGQALYRANIYISEPKYKFTYRNLKKLIKKYGKTNRQISEEVKVFCTQDSLSIEKAKFYEVQHKPCEFYGYYSDYDWVVFCWLFGKMNDLPNGFPMYCNDLKQESDRIHNLKKEEYIKGGGRYFINKMSNHLNYPKQTNEHNALAVAKWNKQLYNFLNNL